MKLRSIDILGFKSFRTRTTLQIGDGLTAVVGPNGCGKSNVVDAIRWAMGAQNPRDLRGRDMEDVIFSGSQHHRPQGLAEVSLVFENRGADVPEVWKAWDSLRVTRRLFRGGDGEYEINGTRVRLRDVHELFLGTGVGSRDAYSIIEQGRIGSLVTSRPEDRRPLIEEAAGVTRYRYQKKQAEKRLEQARENLARVIDLNREVARQVASLARQAERAEAWRALDQRRTELELHLLVRRHDDATTAVGRARAIEGESLGHLQEARRALAPAIAHHEATRVELLVRERAANGTMEAAVRAQARIELAEAGLRHIRTQLDTLAEGTNAAHDEARRDRDRIDALREAIGRDEEEVASLRGAIGRLQSQVEATDEALAVALADRAAATAARDEIRSGLSRVEAERARCQAESEVLVRERDRLRERLGSLEMERDGAWMRREAARMAEVAARDAHHAEEERCATAQVELDAAVAEERAARAAALDARSSGEKLEALCDRLAVRHRTLAAELAAGAGYDDSTRKVLAAAARGEVPGVLRPVAERLDAPAGLWPALEAAFGPALSTILCESREAAREVARFARNGGLRIRVWSGPLRAGSPLPDVVAREGIPVPLFDALAEFSGTADVLETPSSGPVLDVLGTAILPDDTLVVRGGARGAFDALVAVRGEFRTVEEALRDAEARRAEHRLVAASAERNLERAFRRRSACDEAHVTARQRVVASREVLESAQATVRREEFESTRGDQDTNRVVEELARRVAEASTLASRLEALSSQMVDLQASLRGVDARVREVEERASIADRQARDARTQRAEHVARQTALEASVSRDARELADAERRLRDRMVRVERDAERRAGLMEALSVETLRADEARKSFEDAERARDDARVALERVRGDERAAEAAWSSARARVEQGERELRAAESAVAEAESALRLVEALLEERFSTTAADAVAALASVSFPEDPSVELVGVRERLERLGAVNPDASREHAEAAERQTFLEREQADLERAIDDLEAAIRTLDRTSRERFIETFRQVDAQFRAVYARLVPGGRGWLELTDPEDVLETGVEIVVQPPGKRIQNMNLLSGGEKALTAVALVFAIFEVRPTPFCVLDEVDAPLDESNVGRFASLVRAMATSTQFLLITHNRRVMESVDTLYGVTMDEPGVSRVVGVRLRGPTGDEGESGAQASV